LPRTLAKNNPQQNPPLWNPNQDVSATEQESNYERVRTILEREFQEAVRRRELASLRFAEANNDIPSGLPHPDGTPRIYTASREYSAALKGLLGALQRLTDFRESRMVPEDLKPHG